MDVLASFPYGKYSPYDNLLFYDTIQSYGTLLPFNTHLLYDMSICYRTRANGRVGENKGEGYDWGLGALMQESHTHNMSLSQYCKWQHRCIAKLESGREGITRNLYDSELRALLCRSMSS